MKKSLIFGDILALLITTLIGFVTHSETDLSFFPRFLAAFLPLTLAWFLLAPWFGLFQPEITSNPKQLWRVPVVMFFVASLAGVIRSLILQADIAPIFVIILGATTALGMIVWRIIHFLFIQKSR